VKVVAAGLLRYDTSLARFSDSIRHRIKPDLIEVVIGVKNGDAAS
jgi:hypothetical protein